MRWHCIKPALLLLLLYGPALLAEQPPAADLSLEEPSPQGEGVKSTALPAAPPPQLTVENINKATEVLRDPTVISEKMEQRLKGLASPTVKNAPPPPGDSAPDGGLKDPTLMNQNFRDALNRKTNKAVNGPAGPASETPVLPKIRLLASVCGGQKNTNSAMLDINGKTHMVRADDKFSFVDNNRVMEIQVIEIHEHYVKVMVLPFNETLILR